MRLGILARRVFPALCFTVGTSVAADAPPSWAPSQTPRVMPRSASKAPKTLEISDNSPTPPNKALPKSTLPVPSTEIPLPAPVPSEFPLGPSGPSEIVGPPPFGSEPTNYTWIRAEYLFWHLSGGNLPPLVTTGSGTLFGNENPIEDARSGGRLTVGTWVDSTRAIGVEAGGFMIGRSDESFRGFSTSGSLTLFSSPFNAPITGQAGAITVASPGVAAGSTQVSLAGRGFIGGEALARILMSSGAAWRADALVGYRYRGYTEALDIRNAVNPLPLGVPAGTLVSRTDSLRAENQFQGALLGVDYQKDWGSWTMTVRPTLGIGIMDNTVSRSGYTLVDVPGMSRLSYPGGVYNLPTNLGDVTARDWTVIPELDLRVSKQVCSFLRVTVGYSALYFPTMVRVGDQIDPVVNSNYLPPPAIPATGPLRPSPLLERNSAWLQGLTVGLEMRF